jgi:hypothetical protein
LTDSQQSSGLLIAYGEKMTGFFASDFLGKKIFAQRFLPRYKFILVIWGRLWAAHHIPPEFFKERLATVGSQILNTLKALEP